jgi:6-phosphogluconate dehydrogenase
MQLGMVGLGRMGANMVRRLLKADHQCVVYNRSPQSVKELAQEGAAGTASPAELVKALTPPRAVWLMVPAAAVDSTIEGLVPHLAPGDILIDGGNSYYVDDIRRAKELAPKRIHYVDVGTSGGVWGLTRGYCMMIGGEESVVARLDPIFASLAPAWAPSRARPVARRTPARRSRATCGAAGTAPATSSRWCTTASSTGSWPPTPKGSGFSAPPTSASASTRLMPRRRRCASPSTTSTTSISRDHGSMAPGQRRGLVAAGLDRRRAARRSVPSSLRGRVSDSGEGRWTIKAAIDESVPVPVLSTALHQRFSSRGEAEFQNKVLSAMRHAFGGHLEKSAGG